MLVAFGRIARTVVSRSPHRNVTSDETYFPGLNSPAIETSRRRQYPNLRGLCEIQVSDIVGYNVSQSIA